MADEIDHSSRIGAGAKGAAGTAGTAEGIA